MYLDGFGFEEMFLDSHDLDVVLLTSGFELKKFYVFEYSLLYVASLKCFGVYACSDRVSFILGVLVAVLDRSS